MNPESAGPAPLDVAPFAPKSTNRRKSTLGVVGLVLTTAAVAVAGPLAAGHGAAATTAKAVEPLPVSVRVLPVAEEVVASGLRY